MVSARPGCLQKNQAKRSSLAGRDNVELRKYPRTYHLPWSLGASSDDRILSSAEHFVGKDVVVTCKMDGENTTVYPGGYTHARSLDSGSHPSRDWMRAEAARIGRDIPDDIRINGENCFARHSIHYTSLPSYFLVFGMVESRGDAETVLDWDTTVAYAEMLGLRVVPVLYRGLWDEERVRACYTGTSCGGVQEGYVVRMADSFPLSQFDRALAKYVRAGHVTSNQHWFHGPVVQNGLR